MGERERGDGRGRGEQREGNAQHKLITHRVDQGCTLSVACVDVNVFISFEHAHMENVSIFSQKPLSCFLVVLRCCCGVVVACLWCLPQCQWRDLCLFGAMRSVMLPEPEKTFAATKAFGLQTEAVPMFSVTSPRSMIHARSKKRPTTRRRGAANTWRLFASASSEQRQRSPRPRERTHLQAKIADEQGDNWSGIKTKQTETALTIEENFFKKNESR